MRSIIEVAAPLVSITLSLLALVGAYLSFRAKMRADERARATRLAKSHEQIAVVDVAGPVDTDDTPLDWKESEDEQA